MMHYLRLAPVIAIALAACSPQATTNSVTETDTTALVNAAPPEPVPPEAANVANEAAPAPSATMTVLGLEGLGDLKIGEALPAGTGWAVRGAQTSDSCQTASAPDYPGVYAIVSGGKVRRITLGKNSTVRLAEGIGVGDSEAEVKKWFAGFRAEPHKYEAAPAKYLTAPNAPGGSSALRFEIGHDGKVALIHVGTMPELGYVEGCS